MYRTPYRNWDKGALISEPYVIRSDSKKGKSGNNKGRVTCHNSLNKTCNLHRRS